MKKIEKDIMQLIWKEQYKGMKDIYKRIYESFIGTKPKGKLLTTKQSNNG